MWVGTLGSARGYKEELRTYRALVLPAIAVSLTGALAGSLLLLRTPPVLFERLIPWLLLFAVTVFAASPMFTHRVEAHAGERVHGPWQLVLQFLVAIYGGYFGAGIGYLMLAILAFSGLPTMNVMNGIKNLLAACINGIALVPFIVARIVDWRFAVLMAIAAVAGGYFGARFFRRLPSTYTRAGIIVLGSAMTLYFFVKR